jgi:hypothetical protein
MKIELDELQDILDSVDRIPDINIYGTLQRHFKNPLYAKRKQREYKHKFNMEDILKQTESTVNFMIVGDYKYVLTPYCIMGEYEDECYPILIKAKDNDVVEIFYFVDKDKYNINKVSNNITKEDRA